MFIASLCVFLLGSCALVFSAPLIILFASKLVHVSVGHKFSLCKKLNDVRYACVVEGVNLLMHIAHLQNFVTESLESGQCTIIFVITSNLFKHTTAASALSQVLSE